MSIVARELVKQFGAAQAVRSVSFSISPGEVVGLIGPNGAGKTTILRILSTFLPPTSGTAAVADFDCQRAPQEVRRRIGYLPETSPAYPEIRVEEYLRHRARLKDVPRRIRPAEIGRCLECCQLGSVRKRLIGRLSQGFRRRVGLADALLKDPPVLILDEPTIGLDPLQVLHTRELLMRLAETRAILLSTHLLAEAEALCHRVLMLVRGQLRCDVRVADISGAASFEVEVRGPAVAVEQWLQRIPQVRSVARPEPAEVPGTETDWHRFFVTCAPDADIREQVAQECHRSGWGLRELRRNVHSLEDHFVRIALLPEREAA